MKCEQSHGTAIYQIENGNKTVFLSIKNIWDDDSLFAFNTFDGVFLILSNIAFIYGIAKTNNEIGIPQKLFILSSLCGLMTGLISFSSTFFVRSMDVSCLIDFITAMILDGLWLCESFFLITLSVTRFISVKWPFYDIEWQTMKRTIITMLLSILVIFTVCHSIS